MSDSVDQESMLMKPGATARPRASIVFFATAEAKSPTPTMRSPRIATSRDMTFPAGAIVNSSPFNDDVERRVRSSDLSAADDHGKK